MNIVGSILHFGKMRPAAVALVEGDRTISYEELSRLVRQSAGYLALRGVRRGDRVGICLKDGADHIITLLAAAFMGAAVVPLDWRARANENARFVKALELKCVLSEPDLHVIPDCEIHLVDDEWRRATARVEIAGDPETDWADIFVISASSGSTGIPKFTAMTHQQYHFAATGMIELMDLAGTHRFLCSLPLYYSGGRNSCLSHLLRGDCVVLYSSLFSPPEYLDVLSRRQITTAALVPTMVRQFLGRAGTEPVFAGLAKTFSLGAPLHAEEKREALRKLTPNFHERYGTAETLAISVLTPADFAERADSVGRVHSLLQLEVADENGLPVRAGEIGHLRLRGPGVASPLPGQGSEANFRDGWYYPGEIARLDEAGYIFLQGRASDVIIRSGAKVYPAEVEAALAEHPGVVETAVVGCAGAGGDEEVIAFVVTRGSLPVGELLAHCRARLTPHKVPRQIRSVQYLPKNTAGKIDKLALASILGSPATRE